MSNTPDDPFQICRWCGGPWIGPPRVTHLAPRHGNQTAPHHATPYQAAITKARHTGDPYRVQEWVDLVLACRP